MEGVMLELTLSLLAGALGGDGAAKLLKQVDPGVLWNSVAGILGGGLGAAIIAMLVGGAAPDSAMASDAALGIPGVINAALSGGVGGGALLAMVGLIGKAMGGAA
jgi:hypothetical protein